RCARAPSRAPLSMPASSSPPCRSPPHSICCTISGCCACSSACPEPPSLRAPHPLAMQEIEPGRDDDAGAGHRPAVRHVAEHEEAERDRPGELAVDERREHRGRRQPGGGDQEEVAYPPPPPARHPHPPATHTLHLLP